MSKTLVVYVPGLRYGIDKWTPLLDLLREEPQFKDAELLPCPHNCSYFSTKYAENLSQAVAARIEGKWEEAKHQGSPYDNVVLLGHSLGAVLVRQAYLIGLGSDVRGFKSHEWASKVGRIVLFAGVNRGLFPPEEDPKKKYPCKVRRWLGRHVIELFSQIPLIHFLGEDLLAGSPFITNLRLWWMRKVPFLANPPTVIQLIGTEDGLVRSTDSLDIEQDLNGTQIVIPSANHANIIEVRDKKGQTLHEHYALIVKAIFDDFPQTPSPVPADQQKEIVVFVVHGIRANNGEWVKEASDQLQSALPNAEVVPATYWYFSALDFVLPIVRRRRVRWFQDTYAYFLARYPKAEFRFLGHSNGTYLVGESLKQLSGMRFSKIVLAGSVLPRDFDWRSRIGKRQVREVWNHRALRDIPVAVLCNALRGLRMKDVGTGGYEGFAAVPGLHECHYHPGGHGAALEKTHLPILTAQVIGSSAPACQPLVQATNRWFDRMSRAAHGLAYAVLLAVAFVSYGLGVAISSHSTLTLGSSTALAASSLLLLLVVFLKLL